MPKDVLQWQEGTDEPEDEPNTSNGVDVIARPVPTRQPVDNYRRSYGSSTWNEYFRHMLLCCEG